MRRKSISRQVGLSKSANPFAGSASENIEAVSLLNASNIGTMPEGKHLVIVQNFLNRPVWCDSAFYFKDPELRKATYNPYTREGPKPAPPLPALFYAERVEERTRDDVALKKAEAAAAREQAYDDFIFAVDADRLPHTPELGP